MLRLALLFSLTIFLAGCTQPIEPLDKPDTASSSPAAETTDSPNRDSEPMADAPMEESPAEQPSPEPTPEPKPKKGVIHQTTDQVVDAKEWLKKQGIEGKDGDIEGVDPFSRAASSYFTLAAQASTLGLQSAVKNYRALNDRYPTYEEFMQMMRENRIEFAKLRWYEIYGYNEDTGKILVLVDTVAKEEGP